MHPTLFTIGTLNISTYTILLDLGIILGLVLTYFESKRLFGKGETGLDLGLWVVVGGIVGGRLGYVLADWSTFSEDWSRVFRIWEGGLSFHGAFLGGLVVMAIFAWFQRRREDPLSLWDLSDVVTLGLALGMAFGWAACLMGGCAYGRVGEGFGYMIMPDIFGVEAPRFATQVAGFAFALVLFVGFWLLRKHWPFPGASFLMYVMLYFTGHFFLEFTRADEAVHLGPWRLAQVVDLALILAAAVALLVLWWQARGEVEGEELEAAEPTKGHELPSGADPVGAAASSDME